MSDKFPRVNVDILVIRKNKILLGLLAKAWLGKKEQVYGVPGRNIYFNQTIGDAIKDSMKEQAGCNIKKYKIICVNANYELENHIECYLTNKINVAE